MGSGLSSTNSLKNRNLGRVVEITINGEEYKVSDNVPADTSLNTFIREYAHLKGTKFMCLEGGCGTCIAAVTSVHPATGKKHTYAVNTCLIPIFACHGWCITTVEGIGNQTTGYHKITKRLAAANGTQCGYCSPGMVMNMYSLLESNPNITMKEVENSFGGNICRCTGYRPIMDAFKSFASDSPNELRQQLQDIEDLSCPASGEPCKNSHCSKNCHKLPDISSKGLYFQLKGGSSWFRPEIKQEVFEILDMIGDKSYRLIAGNTGQGVYRYDSEPEVYIDLNGIADLHSLEVTDAGITMGANVNLTEAMEFFYQKAKEVPERFSYCKTLADHIDLIANVPVRNAGTFAGNIFMKHCHHEFPSDVFLFLEMVGAQLIIVNSTGIESQIGLLEFLEFDMKGKLILKILLPSLDSKVYVTRSYKIMPRAQNAHAFVNAAFKFKFDTTSYTILERPTVLFGGIRPEFLHANKTEDFLKDKKLLNETTLKGALEILESELKPDHVLPDATPEYRMGLALSLFYKFVLSVNPEEVDEKYRSGGSILQRPVSSAIQDFDTDPKEWPINKPMPKIEGLRQCSGEAEYVNDIPHIQGQLWSQLVLCDRARAVIAKIDASEALKMDGVVAFYSAEDIPGKNSYYPANVFYTEDLTVFSEGRTNYAGEAVGVIVAESHALACKAAKLVKIEYSDQQKVYSNGRDVLKDDVKERITDGPGKIEPTCQGKDIQYKISGTFDLGSQYHYTMETLTCLAVPKENEIDIYPTAQWPCIVQEAASQVLKLPQNKINIHVRRLGGAYGAKITNAAHTTCVTSLAALKLKRPVRLVLSLETNTAWGGKRFPVLSDYEIGVNGEGVIQYMNLKIYQDNGYASSDSALIGTPYHVVSCYDPSSWNIQTYNLKTDTPSNTFCRGPASTEGVCIIETIMDHIANIVGKDPVDVRLANLDKNDNSVAELIQDIKKTSDYDNRVKEVKEYNQSNRWKKRGISLAAMRYPVELFGCYHGLVSIYGLDGTVSISHGAIEMGQGVNTKVVQVAAKILGIDVWKISIKPFNSHESPNDSSTGGSIASECACLAVKKCCEELNARLEPVKKALGDKATWEEICKQAFFESVDLRAGYYQTQADVKGYKIYGVAVLEVEIDLLTGQYHTRRVDILEDAGSSISPEIDIGQVEGAFIMGLGYYTCEEIVYESEMGRLLTNRTWNYKPPGAKDIPIDFRVTLRKNSFNPFGVLRSKATGEPPLCLSCSVLLAIRNALESARRETGVKQELWFDFNAPYTAEKIWLAGLTTKDMFKL